MSDENVELVRRIYDVWARGESARDLIAEDMEYVNPSYAIEPGTRRGRKSLSVVRGDDVVVLARYPASGTGSGVQLEGEHA